MDPLPDAYSPHIGQIKDENLYIFELFNNPSAEETYVIVFEPKAKNVWQFKEFYGPLILLNIILLPVIFVLAYFVSIVYRRLYIKHQIQENYLIQKSKMAAIGEMLGFISHEWRQPLGSMASEIMRIKTDIQIGNSDDKQFIEVLNNQEKELKHLSETLSFFKSFYEPSDNNEDFSITHTVEKAIKFVSYRLLKHSITIEQTYQKEMPQYYYGSEFAFMTVIINILTNAVDAFINRQTEHALITITAKTKNNRITVAIADNAGGTEGVEANILFKPYYTTKKGSGGTGLGLYIAKLIMREKFRGDITAESQEDGLCFNVSLPTDRTTL